MSWGRQDVDQYAKTLDREVFKAVRGTAKLKTEKRAQVLWRDFEDPHRLRKAAAAIKQRVVENLDTYLEQAEASLIANGARVHWAEDGEGANAIIHQIMSERGLTRMVKSKSMASEETGLAAYLEERGMEAVETDLGEFIVQLDHDRPSHIVTPIIHKNRRQVGRTFEREGIGPYSEDPRELTSMARSYLRRKYLEADVGLTGANFVLADTGRIVLVTNEGNARFAMAATKVHIVLVGIEKLLPRQSDLPVFLSLLSRSATAQKLTIYTQLIGGPKAVGQQDGPEEMHLVFLDNGRSRVLATECREILRCIRCGACLNVCPVYRQVSGHGYRAVYPGPVGAVLSPLLKEGQFPELADLPKASSLCGACHEVCPVDIPIPDLLLRLRRKAKREGAARASIGVPDFKMWAHLATSPFAWKSALRFGRMSNWAPQGWVKLHPSARAWSLFHATPRVKGGAFRDWLKGRSARSESEELGPR